MTRLLLDYGVFSLTLISLKDVALSIIDKGSIDAIHLLLSVLGGIYTTVLIVNKVLDGKASRKKSYLESERLKREIWEMDEEEDIMTRHERDEENK